MMGDEFWIFYILISLRFEGQPSKTKDDVKRTCKSVYFLFGVGSRAN